MMTEVPFINFKLRENDNWVERDTDYFFTSKQVLLLSLPGAFTPTCSTQQLPGFEENYGKFQEKGIDEVYCLSVNDSFVMNAWFKDLGIENVKSLPDGARSFTMSIGALCEKNNLGFGFRSWRYAIVVNDGVVENVFSEEGFGNNIETDPYEVSTPENVLDNI